MPAMMTMMIMRPFGRFLQGTLLSEHEMEGGDPFRSLMSQARGSGTAALQSDMLEL